MNPDQQPEQTSPTDNPLTTAVGDPATPEPISAQQSITPTSGETQTSAWPMPEEQSQSIAPSLEPIAPLQETTPPVVDTTVNQSNAVESTPVLETVVDPAVASAEVEPQPTVVVDPAFVVAPEPQNPKKKKLVAGIVIAVGSLLLVLGAAYAVYALWYNNPNKVVGDALSGFVAAKDMDITGDFISQSSTNKTTGKGVLTIDAESRLHATLGYEVASSDTSSGLDFAFAADKEKVYAKVSGLRQQFVAIAGEENSEMVDLYYGALLKKLDDKWIAASYQDLETLSSAENTAATCSQQAYATFRSDTAQQRELGNAFSNNMFIDITQNGTETVNGTLSNRYTLAFNSGVFEKFVGELKTTAIFKALNECNKGSLAQSLDDVIKESKRDTSVADASKPIYELWVSTWGHVVTKLSVSNRHAETGTSTSLSIYPKINTNATVTMPESSTSFKDVQSELQQFIAPFSTTKSTTNVSAEVGSTYY